MVDRRQHYRHEFAPTHSLAVRLQSLDNSVTVKGELIDLSIGGMCLHAPGLSKEASQQWIATMTLDTADAPLSIFAQHVHWRGGTRECCGFRFLDDADERMAQEREKAIWQFLLTKQQQRRRHLTGW